MRGAIVVFAKAPRAGFVKTRMCPPLDPEEAADLYSAMLDDVLETTLHVARALDLAPFLSVAPADAQIEMSRRAPHGYDVIVQRGRDLSERMTWAVAEAAATGASPILIRGSDCPTLDFACVRGAVEALSDHDVAIAPDVDGGYNLVAMRAPAPGLFEHPMSTDSVLEDTLARARELGLSARVLDETFDLDTAEDIGMLGRRRREVDSHACHRTLAFLDDRNLWRREQLEPSEPGRGLP